MPFGDLIDALRNNRPEQVGGQEGGSASTPLPVASLFSDLDALSPTDTALPVVTTPPPVTRGLASLGAPAPTPSGPPPVTRGLEQLGRGGRPVTPQTLARQAQRGFSATQSQRDMARESIRQGRQGISFAELSEMPPATIVILAQQLIPQLRGEGFRVFQEKRASGLSTDRAILAGFEAQDLPSFQVSGQRVAPDDITGQQRMRLAQRGIETDIQREPIPEEGRPRLGLKGALQQFGQPDILIPGAVVATRGARAIGRLAAAGAKQHAEDLVSLGGKFAAQQMPIVKRLVKEVDKAKVIRPEVEASQAVELSQKAARIDRIIQGSDDIRDAVRLSRAARSGELTKGSLESIIGKFSDDEIDELLTIIRDSPDVMPFERVRAFQLFDPSDADSLLNGKLPTPGEVGLLEQVFGEELAEALLKKTPASLGSKIRTGLVEAANIPRTTFSSFDISAPGRQGAPLLAANPKVSSSAFAAQLRAFNSEKAAVQVVRDIARHPDAPLLDRAGVFIAELQGPRSGARLKFNPKTGKVDESSTLSNREEAFISRLPERIPIIGRGIRASERAYVTYLNKTRADVFYGTIKEWRKAGKPITNDALRNLGDMVNNLSGRGSLDFFGFEGGEKARPLLSALFFSPGLQASRIQLVASLFDPTVDQRVRKQLYKNVAASTALGTAALGALWASGADVELDPRSTNFGRGKIGGTRIDFWGGFQPYARFAAQMATQETKTSAGDIRSLPEDFGTTRAGQVTRFGRQKFSPGFSVLFDALEGETVLGEDPLTPENAANTVIPGAIQDFADAISEQGSLGAALSLPAFLGIGVTSYSTVGDLENALASRLPDDEGNVGRTMQQLEPWERDIIRKDPEVADRLKQLEERRKPAPLHELRNVVFDQNDSFKEQFEGRLLKQVDAGLKGRNLLDAIQQFNRDRFASGQAIFAPFRERLFKAPDIKRDELAQKYWTAPLNIDPETGKLDFDDRDRIRRSVLAEAKEFGIKESYITGSGKGTWRNTFSDNPEIDALLSKYETDMSALREYWDVGTTPNFGGARNAEIWETYLDASQAERRELARGNSALRRITRKQSEARAALREDNTKVDKALVEWYEYLGRTPSGRRLYRDLYINPE